MTFDTFHTEDTFDVLRIFDGPSSSGLLLASLSGFKSSPVTYLSNGTSLWFQFSTNGGITKKGFHATYKSGIVLYYSKNLNPVTPKSDHV